MLTPKQRAQVSRLRYKGFTEVGVANHLGVSLAEVQALRAGPGRPRADEYDGPSTARTALRQALKKKAVSDRFLSVKCVLANYGDMLGLGVEDAKRVIEDYLAGRAG